MQIVLLGKDFSLRRVKEEDATKKPEDVKSHEKKLTLETSVTLIGSVRDLGIAIDIVHSTPNLMEYAKKLVDPLRHVTTFAQTPILIAKEMNYLIHLEMAALNTIRTLVGVATMTQRNSSHSRCAVSVVALLVIESLAVGHLCAPMIQPALMNNVYLSTLVMIAQMTLIVKKETMCFALTLSVPSSVILEPLARVMKHAKKI